MSRPFGSKNKTGAAVKEQMLACYERLGGLQAYTEWAKENKGAFYKQFASLAPKELRVDARIVDESSLSDAELAAIATGSSESAAETPSGENVTSELH